MKGRYNTANIMIDTIEETAKEQIQGFLNHPAFADTYIAVMPDCHAGKGAVVGFTMKANQYVIPNIIGVDIGCGMLMAKFLLHEVDLPALDEAIKRVIPSGFAVNQTISASKPTISEVTNVCGMIGIDTEKALKAIGSLGGGNHFIEAGFDQHHNLVITIHSGSRNFGKCVATFYQQKAKEGLERYFIRDQYKELEFMPMDSDDGMNYLHGMAVAQRFASENRKEMMRRLSMHLRAEPVELIESVHNFIGDDNVIRKGATSARSGEKVIIPFNMADGIALCIGKGSKKYNNSAPHGAGRILSRTQAKKRLSLDGFTKQMKVAGVYTTTACAATLDEAPGAYKPMDLILENIKETVDVIEVIKPVYNFKAGGDQEK
jgi:RNA-splicing ligase RtcB